MSTIIKTEWNLQMLYISAQDSRIEKDIQYAEKKYKTFARKYKNNKKYTTSEYALFQALTDYEDLIGTLNLARPLMYFSYRKDIQSEDKEAESKLNILSERLARLENIVIFFELAIAQIPVALQKKFLKSKKLKHFKYFLSCVWKRAEHDLSESEEKILGLKALPSYTLWVQSFDTFLSSQTVLWKGSEISLGEAMPKVSELAQLERKELHSKVIEKLKNISFFAESEINAIVINKKIDDELRGFSFPEDRTILSYQNDKKTISALIQTVTDNFFISHAFYTIKARLLKQPFLEYCDRAVGIGKDQKQISFEESFALLFSVFSKADSRFSNILESFVKNGQVDVFPKKGKTGGAYCSGNINTPTFVLLNHTNTFDSAMTYAHEMGHAIHTEFSKSQSPLYQNYSTSTAEVASTFFETLFFDSVFETLSPKEKIVALHNRINDDVQTIFRQTACFNFEKEIHKEIREKGLMPKEQLALCMNKHMTSYLGPITKLSPDDGYYFVGWGHIRRFFYVYSYVFGQLVSKALYAEYKKDKTYIEKIIKFLSAGGSLSPEMIFKDIGIDVTKPDFFLKGLKSIEADIKLLDELSSKSL